MLPAVGKATASANAVDTAASTALPPDAKMSAPTLVATASSLTTMARADRGAGAPAAYGQSGGKLGVAAGATVVARGSDGAEREAAGDGWATCAAPLQPAADSNPAAAIAAKRAIAPLRSFDMDVLFSASAAHMP